MEQEFDKPRISPFSELFDLLEQIQFSTTVKKHKQLSTGSLCTGSRMSIDIFGEVQTVQAVQVQCSEDLAPGDHSSETHRSQAKVPWSLCWHPWRPCWPCWPCCRPTCARKSRKSQGAEGSEGRERDSRRSSSEGDLRGRIQRYWHGRMKSPRGGY